MEIGLRRSAEIFSTIPLRLGRYLLEESIGQRSEPHHPHLAMVSSPDTDALPSEEGKLKVVQAYTDIQRC
jgi:hypothetical protein